MSVETLSGLELEPYFALLQQAYPDAAGFWLCNATGEVLVAGPDGMPEPPSLAPPAEAAVADDPDVRSRVRVGDSGSTWSCGIHDHADRLAGMLVGHFPARDQPEPASLVRIAGLIGNEYRLQQELNDMATELYVRYEELNLVYDSQDRSTGFIHNHDNIRHLLDHYIEHVDVDLVALICPQQEQRLCATGESGNAWNTDEVMHWLEQDLLPVMHRSKAGILDNSPDGGRYAIHCKLLAFPLLNSRAQLEGMFVCLNQPHRKDFYNSDRSLLAVIAHKIEKINQLNFDSLTHLMNLQPFRHALQHALEQPDPADIPLCLLDVDLHQLRVVNDNYGRTAGDHVIEHIAGMLTGSLRSSDIICYKGEGRFSVLLKQCNADQARMIAHKLAERVRQSSIEWYGNRIDVLINTGITPVDNGGYSVDDLLETAELARLTARKGGSEQIQLYRPDDAELLAHRQDMQIVTRVREAMRDDSLLLYCQTIQPVAASRERYHMEILVRMSGKDGSIIRPDQFIQVAEKFGLMMQLDRWVINATLAHLAAAGIRSGITSINLSGQSLADTQLGDFIEHKLQEHAIAPASICFEVTETVAIGNRQVALGMINRLRTLGCRFSLDDFGTGLSSFSYLRELPVDFVKIDGSFIREILHDQVAHAMVASIIQISHIMGLSTVAEYVENRELADRLRMMGVDYLQGYGIHQPQLLQDYLAAIPGSRTATRAG
jgi:diguanylate cyclase (GGDEF)-like protein